MLDLSRGHDDSESRMCLKRDREEKGKNKANAARDWKQHGINSEELFLL